MKTFDDASVWFTDRAVTMPYNCPHRFRKGILQLCALRSPGQVCVCADTICPVERGEWGAWRSDGGSMSRAWGAAEDWAARDPWLSLDSAGAMIDRAYGRGLDAAGWLA